LIAGGAVAKDHLMPVIRKAQRLVGNQLILRNADVGDAEFIVRLRTDPQKRRFISATSPELAPQIAWLTQYACTANEAYFIAEDMRGDKVGTIRLYDPVDDSFCFGSWIMKDGVPINCGVESLLMVYHYALEILGFNRSYFAVRKDNRSVWRFMERFGGVRTRETDIDYWYETQRAPVLESFKRYAVLLPTGIRVIHDPVS
jgi:RimJ/RimL family protein N-acetyltransferase